MVGGQGMAVQVKRLIEYLSNRNKLAYLVRVLRKRDDFAGEL
jgi:hypothetical protein